MSQGLIFIQTSSFFLFVIQYEGYIKVMESSYLVFDIFFKFLLCVEFI